MQLLKNLVLGLSIAILSAAVLLGTWLTVFAEGEVFSSSESQNPLKPEMDCSPPEGWSVYRVHTGDTLTSLADQLQIDRVVLMSMNCIDSDISPGDTIYLPLLDPLSPTPACGPPPNWVLHPLQEGDSLSNLAARFEVDEALLWHANCMDIHTILQPGMSMYGPPLP